MDSTIQIQAALRPQDGGVTPTPGERTGRIDVALAHGDCVVRAGVAALLGGYADLRLDPARAAAPWYGGADVIIFDYHGGLAYLRAQAQRHGGAPAPKVLLLTQRDKEWDVRNALRAGVQGYLPQTAGAEQMAAAIRAVRQGLLHLDDELNERLADSRSRPELTCREYDVLQRLARGESNKEIARRLGIGAGTVKTYVKNVCGKLAASTRTQAVVLAFQRGLVDDDGAPGFS